MTTHLTKIWWDLNKHKLVEQAIPEADIYKRDWAGLTGEELDLIARTADDLYAAALQAEAKLREKNQ